MMHDAFLRAALVSLEVNDTFSEAFITMRDQSRLHFRHRPGERWVNAETVADGPSSEDALTFSHGDAGHDSPTTLAGRVLLTIAMFRLNAKHLDVQLNDGSRWEAVFRP
jgi:hypothetical protein